MEPEHTDTSSCPAHMWVLTNLHPGNRIQAVALAEALGRPYEVKELHFTRWSRWRDSLPFLPLTAGLDRRKSSPLEPPWPELVIGVGRSTAPITRWVGRAGKGRTLTVQLGRVDRQSPLPAEAPEVARWLKNMLSKLLLFQIYVHRKEFS